MVKNRQIPRKATGWFTFCIRTARLKRCLLYDCLEISRLSRECRWYGVKNVYGTDLVRGMGEGKPAALKDTPYRERIRIK